MPLSAIIAPLAVKTAKPQLALPDDVPLLPTAVVINHTAVLH